MLKDFSRKGLNIFLHSDDLYYYDPIVEIGIKNGISCWIDNLASGVSATEMLATIFFRINRIRDMKTSATLITATTRIFGFLALAMLTTQGGITQVNAQETETLNRKQQAIVPIAALTAKGDIEPLKEALAEGLDTGLSISEIKEILVHLYAYTGFPRSLNALTTFKYVLDERSAKGIRDAEGVEASPISTDKSVLESGTEVQTRLSGRPVEGGILTFAPAIDYCLKAHLFGYLFGRDNLDETSREIATLSALSALDGTSGQIQSHLRYAANAGLSREQIWQIVHTLRCKVGLREAWRADQVLSTTFRKKHSVPEPVDDVFPRGRISTANYFTGEVFNQRLVSADNDTPCQVSNVTFRAGARTRWHTHTGTQILLCTAGRGWYQEKGKPARALSSGDAVKIPPGTLHWHGASTDCEFSHISLIPNPAKNKDTWLEAVSEEDYIKANNK